jgi:hypothetical protein
MLTDAMVGSSTNGKEGPGEGPVPVPAIVAFTLIAIAVALVTLYSMWVFWPINGQGAMLTAKQSVSWFGWHLSAARELLFFLTVALAGGLGGLIHTIRSFGEYVGERELRWSWIPRYLLLPFVGSLTGTVFYMVLRAGLFSPSTSVQQASPFGFAAIAILAGLFSPQALEKLRNLASHIFTDPPKRKDDLSGT